MKFILPYPPSGNRYWRVFRGRPVVSAEAKAYKLRVRLENLRVKPMPGSLVLKRFHAYRPQKRGDLDNLFKVALDALNGIAWVDDKQLRRFEDVELFDDKENPRIELIVEPYIQAVTALPAKRKKQLAGVLG